MTYEEALDWFREELEGGKCSDTCVQCNANEKAIEALGKQIPKKPIHSHNGIKSVYECPVCHYPLLYKCGCYNNECRQMIDWSEEE